MKEYLIFILALMLISPFKVIYANSNIAVGKSINALIMDQGLSECMAYAITGELDSNYELSLDDILDLKQIDLSMCQIESMQGIEYFTEIEVLHLGYNNLKTFPIEVIELNNLKELSIAFNDQLIGGIPTEINRLKELEFLELSGTRIDKIPDTIAELSKLQYLSVDFTEIDHLPDNLSELSSLMFLVANNTKLTKLPESLTKIASLIYIAFDNNNLIEFTEEEFDFFYETGNSMFGLHGKSEDTNKANVNSDFKITGLSIFNQLANLHTKQKIKLNTYVVDFIEGDTLEKLFEKAIDLETGEYLKDSITDEIVKDNQLIVPSRLLTRVGRYALLFEVCEDTLCGLNYYHEFEVPATVVAHHVDTEGNILSESVVHFGRVGSTYETMHQYFSQYKLIKVPTNSKGLFEEFVQNVTYVYSKIESIEELTPDPDVIEKPSITPDVPEEIIIAPDMPGEGIITPDEPEEIITRPDEPEKIIIAPENLTQKPDKKDTEELPQTGILNIRLQGSLLFICGFILLNICPKNKKKNDVLTEEYD